MGRKTDARQRRLLPAVDRDWQVGTHYAEDHDVTIHRGDCLELLAALPPMGRPNSWSRRPPTTLEKSTRRGSI